MSKLIIEMDMPENCMRCAFSTECSFCEGYDDHCILAPKDAEYKWNFSDGIEPSARPSWCPIKGEISEIELMHLEEERAFTAKNIIVELFKC